MTNLRKFGILPMCKGGAILTLASVLIITTAWILLATPSAQAQTYSVIHNFTYESDGGGYPMAGVTLRGGVLFGISQGGQGGSVYELTKAGSSWSEAILSPLALGGSEPEARVLFGPDGHLYGTSRINYDDNYGRIFELTPPATNCSSIRCFWKEDLVHRFTSYSDGGEPLFADLVWDQQGNMYGTTASGGSDGAGTVYEVQRAGNGWTETPIFSFPGFDGGYEPYGGVIFDDNGNLFGMTNGGGPDGGIVFELTYTNGVGWTETVLHTFQNYDDGRFPAGGLVRDSAGNLYGSSSDGGFGGGGAIFELSPSGSAWTFTVIASLHGSGVCGPWASLSLDAAGNLYGTTKCEGAHQAGNVFKLTNLGDHWQYTSLYDFAGGPDGGHPISSVTIDADGTLYGTATNGGSEGQGVVWMIEP